jgi:hypothetical protein
MTPVIVALYEDFGVAERVRTELVADGFPTDRVELTSKLEQGQADTEPGDSQWKKISNYFHAICDQTGDNATADQFADRIRGGSSAITVHPRTDYEMDSARTILRKSNPSEFQEYTTTN